ncbi:MAG: PhoH family protein [Nitrospinae bacterium]|nr:PhoH family protein [Nitrospinota bacterium]
MRSLTLKDSRYIPDLYGIKDKHLRLIEKSFDVRVTTKGSTLTIKGSENATQLVERLLGDLYNLVEGGYSLQNNDLKYLLRILKDDPEVDITTIFSERIDVPSRKRFITPKSLIQRDYVAAMRRNDIVIGIGPAGTGKTYLAMAMAVNGLKSKEFARIVLTRPAVEAGEKLGFLPGDIADKVRPYLRPLYDALYDMLEFDEAQRLIERGSIEIAPLAYMRGRTLNDSFIILDEAQNSTSEQMKMFLTRMGFQSKVVITGDVTQVDLPEEKRSGLVNIQEVLEDIEGIRFVYFSEKDVVRHDLVQEIVKAYERHDSRKERVS